VTGYLYRAGDVTALAGLLEPLLADPARAEAMGRAAVAEVQSRWTLDLEVGALRDLYTRMERLR